MEISEILSTKVYFKLEKKTLSLSIIISLNLSTMYKKINYFYFFKKVFYFITKKKKKRKEKGIR